MLLGPNGAGKSTLFGILSTALHAHAGHFTVNGARLDDRKAVEAYQASLGVVPQGLKVFGSYTAQEFMLYVSWLRRMPPEGLSSRIDASLAAVGMTDQKDTAVRAMSGGIRQRLVLASALVNSPGLLLLDEPTVGLDPLQRAEFLGYIRTLSETTTVLMATHIVDDVATVAKEVAVIVEGKMRFAGALSSFCQSEGPVTSADVEDAYRRVVEKSA